MSKEFDVANREVRFFLNEHGGVQVGSLHPRKTTVGALGIDSRHLTMLSRVNKDIYFTLDREIADSIAQAILKTGVVVDGGLVGQTPIVELFQLASSFPDFFGTFTSFGAIPTEYLEDVRHTVPVHFYSQEQKIRAIGPDEVRELDDGMVEVAVPVEIESLICTQEFELMGKLKSYSFEIPGISGVAYIIDRQDKYQGKKAGFNGLTIQVPGFPDATLQCKNLAQLCLLGDTEFDFTAGKGE